jgi:hypothetical protein
VKQIDTFYQQHTQQSVKKNKKVQSEKFELHESSEQNIELEQDDFEQYAAEQQQAREQAKQLDNNRNVNKLSNGSTVT